VFVILGASASWIGSLLRTELSRQVEVLGFAFNPVTTLAGLIIIAMGLHFLGVFRMFWVSREVRYQHKEHPGGLAGAYLIGLAFAFGWTPCIGPVLGMILTVAASEQDVLKGAGLLAVYSAGLGIPFLLAAAAVGTFMGFMAGFRKHLGMVEKVAGALLVVSGLMFITGGVQAVSYWLIEQFPFLLNLG
jgi:cytochrome c-type biogenesis protein